MSYKAGALFKERVSKIVSEDDVNEFDNYVAKIAALPSEHYPTLLDLCLEQQALNCTLYLLQGNLPHGPPTLHNQLVEHDDCIPALFTALASMPEPQLIHLLLNHCGADHHVNQTILGFYPLHFALAPLCKLVHLSNWFPGQSLVKLLLLLFLPQTRPTLECAQLVAEYTNSVNEVALGFIQHGEVLQLAGLLLVAREKAMHPLSTGHTIKQGICMEDLVLQAIHGEGDTETMCAAGLVDVFDKAGDKLATYYKSLSKNEPAADEVIVRVAEILRSVGIQVLFTDVDLTDINRSSINHADLSYICKRLGIQMDDTTQEVQMNRNSMFSSWEAYKQPFVNTMSLNSEFLSKRTAEGYGSSPHNPIGASTYSTSSPKFGGKINIFRSGTYSTSSPRFGGNRISLGTYSTSSTRSFSTSSLIVDKISTQHWNHPKLRTFSTAKISSRHLWTCSLSCLALKLKRGVKLV